MTKKTVPAPAPPASKIEINPGFRRALDIMEGTSHHVFITGKAGTGKSTLLELWRGQTLKRIAVLAPTGVAALNVRGQTIHSFFGFKPDVTPDAVRKLGKGRGAAADRIALYRNLDAIVIDEVSMVRADLMDCVEKFLRLNGPRPKERFGGLQMIFIGDLYQLPPVVTGQERGLFAPDPPSLRRGFGPRADPAPAALSAARYESPYFFSARIFAEPDFAMDFVELEKVYRQSDAAFIGLLNAIRNRSVDDAQIALLNSRLDPAFSPPDGKFYITLTSTNDLAAARNREKLASLPGRARRYEGFIEGEFDRRSLPTEEALELKRGAQVMLLTNDRKGRFVNGTIGRVAKITKVPGRRRRYRHGRAPGRRRGRPLPQHLGALPLPVRLRGRPHRIGVRRRVHPIPAAPGLGRDHPQEPGQDLRPRRRRHRPRRLRPRPGLRRPQPLHDRSRASSCGRPSARATSGWTGASSAS